MDNPAVTFAPGAVVQNYDKRTARGAGFIAGLDHLGSTANPYTNAILAAAWEGGRQHAWPHGRDIA